MRNDILVTDLASLKSVCKRLQSFWQCVFLLVIYPMMTTLHHTYNMVISILKTESTKSVGLCCTKITSKVHGFKQQFIISLNSVGGLGGTC